MRLPAPARRVLLAVHVLSSVGWIGAAVAFGVVAVAAGSAGPGALVGLERALEVMTWFAILPLAIASAMTGLVQGLISRWGLWRYYWVVVKEVITALALAVLLLQLPRIQALATNGHSDEATLQSLRLHSLGGAAVLLIPLVLSVLKPRGLTRHGHRRLRAHTTRTAD